MSVMVPGKVCGLNRRWALVRCQGGLTPRLGPYDRASVFVGQITALHQKQHSERDFVESVFSVKMPRILEGGFGAGPSSPSFGEQDSIAPVRSALFTWLPRMPFPSRGVDASDLTSTCSPLHASSAVKSPVACLPATGGRQSTPRIDSNGYLTSDPGVFSPPLPRSLPGRTRPFGSKSGAKGRLPPPRRARPCSLKRCLSGVYPAGKEAAF
jgi:hypothetical protein